jgi:hypothetical protein
MSETESECALCCKSPAKLGGVDKNVLLCEICDEMIEERLRLRTQPKTEEKTTCEEESEEDEEADDNGNPHCDDCDKWSMTTGHRCWTPDGEHMYCEGCAEAHGDEFEEEEEEVETFAKEFPNAKCLRCVTPVNGLTAVLCGGGGGACETWYCGDCHETGTEDCPVCQGH